jgi:NADH:ubiquinone oxidoreductase subunit 3 (subunit A)
MRKINTTNKYLKILIGIVVFLWIIYFIQMLIASKNKNKNKDKNKNKGKEGFTPRIRGLYRPYVRTMNQGFESFVNNYGPNVIMNKLRKWNIY